MRICSLRTYQADDAPRLYEAARESVQDVFQWLPWCHPDYSIAEASDWIGSRAPLASQGVEHSFAIVGPDGRFLGGCGINQINPVHRFGNLGYWVRSSQTGRGVASTAIRQLADFAFEGTDLERLEIVCAVGNQRSQRAAKRAGAHREGVLRRRLILRGVALDAVMYSIVREGEGQRGR